MSADSEAHRRTRKDGAAGVDGQTAEEYAKNLEDNLRSLLSRLKAGTYQAPPVRRVYIPKAKGKQMRPIGIPTFEDKVVQRAVSMLLEAIYEQDFLDCSYGFRVGRSAHQALAAVRKAAMIGNGSWVLEVDLKQFFDTLDHEHLQGILRRRVCDGALLRVLGKWLNAGVLESGAVTFPEAGTPQGGVISPLLANVYLDEVIDQWFQRDVVPRLQGRARLVRYADDLVMLFAWEADARRVLDVLPKRLGKFGLTLHPEKTRLIDFRRRTKGKPSRGRTFDFLGFTHHWGPARKGPSVVKQVTAKDRLSRALRGLREWCRLHRHDPLAVQQKTLAQKMHGHYAYFGISSFTDGGSR